MIETYSCPGCAELFKADVEPNGSKMVLCPSCGNLVEVEGSVPPPPPVNRNLVPRPTVYHPAPLESAEEKEARAERFGVVLKEGGPEITEMPPAGWLGSTIGNLIWFVFGGFFMAVGYMTAGLLSMITIFGIPTGWQGMKIGLYAAWPFGSYVEDRGAGCLGTLGNVIWFLTGGWALMFGHLLWALIFTLLIVTFPFAVMHVRLASLCLAPFGKVVKTY